MTDNSTTPKIRFKFNSNYNRYTLGDITQTIERPLEMKDDLIYSLVTVKRRNEGIVKRGDFCGKDIKVKNQFTIKSGDFLISKRQIIHGACEIVPESLDGSIVSNEYHVLHGKDGILLNEYLNLLSKTLNLKKYFALACVGVDIEKMLFRIDDWNSRSVFIPSIDEQRKVVSFFSLINQKIEKQREKVEQLERFKKGMLQKIFSQEIRFKDDNGQEFSDWGYELFEHVATNNTKKVNPQNMKNVPCIELENIIGSKGQINGYFLSCEQLSTKNQFSKGSILFGKLRPYLKKYWFATFDGLCSSEIWVITSTDPRICKEYLYFVIQSDNFQQAANVSSGSKMPRTEWDSVKNLEIPLPSLEEQKKIASFLFALEEKVSKELSKTEVLIQMKSGLIQQMFI